MHTSTVFVITIRIRIDLFLQSRMLVPSLVYHQDISLPERHFGVSRSFFDVLMMRLLFLWCAWFSFRPVVVLLEQGNSPSFYMYCLGIFNVLMVLIHAFHTFQSMHTHLPDSEEVLSDFFMYSYSHIHFWVLSPACSLLPNWNAFLKHFKLAIRGCLFCGALILAPLPSSLLSLDKTFVLFWGAYHAVPMFRSPLKES